MLRDPRPVQGEGEEEEGEMRPGWGPDRVCVQTPGNGVPFPWDGLLRDGRWAAGVTGRARRKGPRDTDSPFQTCPRDRNPIPKGPLT